TLGVADAWLLDLASGEETRLTHDTTKLSGITWHPGGERLVFSSNRAGGVYGLWEIGADGGALRRWSVLPEAEFPRFAREREVLVFEQWQSAVALRAYDVASGTETALPASTRWDFWPALSPDGEWLAFVSDRSGAAELWLSRADGREPRRLTQMQGPFVQQPAWARDGRALLFAAPLDGQFDAFRIDVASGRLERLTHSAEDERFPGPASDGEGIVFSRRTGNGWVALERDGTGRETVLVEDAFRLVSDSGGRWHYFSHADRDGLWRRPAAGGEPQRVAAGLRPVDAGSWQLARGHVIFVERIDPDAPKLVWLDAETLEETHRLPLAPFYYRAGLTVSSDGRQLIYGVLESEESDLFLYADGTL
ncbi:MAG TPA: hypothetical protein VM616_07030, partial [Gammaproteobacteria bacterium]|nr:hypothetical protein [Gammaproteobacteria bacterium]